jgi:hypothetical protein
MRILSKYLFLFTLAIVNTSLAGLILYISPVLSYVGSVDQIPIIIEGLLSGAIFSSIFGFILSFIPHRLNIKVTLSIILSLLIFSILMTIYFIDSPLPNSSVFLGSFASESFIMVFVVMFYVSTGNATVKNRFFSAVLMFIFNVLVFIMVAIIYLSLGQSDFPYILETIIVVSIICMIPFLGVKNMEPKSSKE